MVAERPGGAGRAGFGNEMKEGGDMEEGHLWTGDIPISCQTSCATADRSRDNLIGKTRGWSDLHGSRNKGG